MSIGLPIISIPNLDTQLAGLKARGLDMATSPICAPSAGTPGAVKGIAGCRHFHRCIFKRKEFGAGKGKGPHNVPYFIDPRDGLGNATEMFMSCILFMQIMNPRRVAGIAAIDEGLDGEVIEVLCEDGELAEEVVMTGFVAINPGNPATLFHRADTAVMVPAFKYPQEMEKKAISNVRERRARRHARNPDHESYVEPEEAAEPEVMDLAGGAEIEPEVVDLGSSEKGKRRGSTV